MIGTLTDFGKAPYQFQENNSDSYFVTLSTPKGERRGKRALARSRNRTKHTSNKQEMQRRNKG